MSVRLYLIMLGKRFLIINFFKERNFLRQPQHFQAGRQPQFYWVARVLLESKLNQIPAISYFPGWRVGLGGGIGWVLGIKIKTNSIQFQLRFPV